MNNQKLKYACLVLLGALTIFSVCKVSRAAEIREVKQITMSGLNLLLVVNEGKVVIVNLWATWCPPCTAEIPGFINLYKKYKDKGLEIIGIAFERQGLEKKLLEFIKKEGIDYPIYLGSQSVGEAYELRGIPTTIIYGKDGQIAAKHVGFISEETFDQEVAELLKK